jgi:hypothetical protein
MPPFTGSSEASFYRDVRMVNRIRWNVHRIKVRFMHALFKLQPRSSEVERCIDGGTNITDVTHRQRVQYPRRIGL